ncbi:MAG: tyrosine-type recombinase/integrase [Acidobacteriota bacterium]|nr:tyrosine-type recombinase/integrase [Acidobacteriota bacterium]
MQQRITKRAVDSLIASNQKPVFLWDRELKGFGVKALPSGRKVFLLQYRMPGDSWKKAPKRLTIGAVGTLTPEQARRRASELLLGIAAGEDPREAIRRQTDTPTMTDLAERFLAEYLPGKKRPPRASTISFYEGLFRCHVTPRLGDIPVADVTTAQVEGLHQTLRHKPYVANRVLSMLQNAFDQAERWQWRPQLSNPARHVERYPEAKRGAKTEVMLSSEQMSALLQAIDAEEAEGGNPTACTAIRFAFWTGWRIGEVLRLEWDRIDMEQGVATLLQTKTAETERRQLPAEAVSLLEEVTRLAGCKYVFPGADARGHLTTVRRPWQNICKRAGLDDLPGLGAFRLHDLRHNVVSWDVSRGVPLEIAGRNVGHRSRRSTEVYAHFAPDALKKAADERARAMREAMEGKD